MLPSFTPVQFWNNSTDVSEVKFIPVESRIGPQSHHLLICYGALRKVHHYHTIRYDLKEGSSGQHAQCGTCLVSHAQSWTCCVGFQATCAVRLDSGWCKAVVSECCKRRCISSSWCW